MPLGILIGETSIPTKIESVKDLRADLNLSFLLEQTLFPSLDDALPTVPNSGKSSVHYASPAAAWVAAGGAVQFGLQGGASGALDVVNGGGELVSFMDGLESPQPKTVAALAGQSYVRLTLNFNLSANVAESYSGGAYGVKSALDTRDTYAITFCKAFAPTTLLRIAIQQTFESFVLPFTSHTLTDLQDGDYLWHEFDGNISLAVGAYVGLDKVLYAGQGRADVMKTFGSPLATLNASVKPEVKIAASMDFKVAYATRFEALMTKTGSSGKLHLFKSSKLSSSTTLTAGLTIDVNIKLDVKEAVTDHLDELKTSIVTAGGGAGSLGGSAIGAVLDQATSRMELQKYVDEATDKLSSWLNRANGVKSNLEVAIETTRARTLLAAYTFDLNGAGFGAAWDGAIRGDLFAALQTGAVTLDIGSGLERDYQSKTSVQCNFFNLWKMSSWSQFQENVSLRYAGNNVFQMVAQVGRSTETDYLGAMRSMDIYFSASADVPAGQSVTNLEISLNIAMNAQGDRKAIEKIATMLSVIDPGQAITDTVRDLRAFSTNTAAGTVQLLIKIPSRGFERIASDAQSGPLDQQNWEGFAHAADDLNAWPLRNLSVVSTEMLAFLKTYFAWEVLNKSLNGTSTPDRNKFGDPSLWPQDMLQVDGSVRALIVYSMWAGQHYMNFCSALQQLGSLAAADAVKTPWEALLKLITNAVKEDLNVDFLRPAALATIRQCRGTAFALTSPAGPAIPTDHFSVSIVL